MRKIDVVAVRYYNNTSMTNRELIQMFSNVADMLAIRGDSIHRVLAYRRAAESIEGLGRDINQVYAEGKLLEMPGIGKVLADKIEEMLTTGELNFYNRLSEDVPPTLVDLLRVEGLGPKRVKQVFETLNVTNLAELTAVARAGKLRELPRMGAKSEAKIVAAIEALQRHGDDRTSVGIAWPIAQRILAELEKIEGVTKTAVAGSLRRMRETIGDIDLLVAAADAEPVMERFCTLENIESVAARGPTKSRIVLLNGLGVDLRVLPAENWGTLISYFTGSKNHNVRLRELALKKGLSLNEHSFSPMDDGEEILCATEEQVYETLGLPYVVPVLREDRGEIEAAVAGELPQLVQLRDLVSDLHMHSTWSDGKVSVLEMAQIAKASGLQYIAITDHSASLGIANGLSIERLRQQAEDIAEAREAMGANFHILHGTEMEIRADGSMDYPDEVLAELDFVIASLHMGLRQPREQVMNRMLSALHNPHVDMIGHPTGRKVSEREGADLDMDVVLETAVQTQTILEINANPRRLDLRDTHVRRAVELGVLLSINTDAHHPEHFELRHYGVATAQRGWATAANVVNCWPFEKLMAHLKRSA